MAATSSIETNNYINLLLEKDEPSQYMRYTILQS